MTRIKMNNTVTAGESSHIVIAIWLLVTQMSLVSLVRKRKSLTSFFSLTGEQKKEAAPTSSLLYSEEWRFILQNKEAFVGCETPSKKGISHQQHMMLSWAFKFSSMIFFFTIESELQKT